MRKTLLFILGLVTLVGCNKVNQKAAVSPIDSVAVVVDTIRQPQRVGIKMIKSGGVYEIPCLVNGVKMNFIFDTGASNVCISLTEALFLLKNGYIDEDDIGGKSKSKVADGRITTDTKLKLKTIEIGGIVLRDVDALVSSSIEAPLLLGQSALRKLGKFEIDGDSLFITGIVENPQVVLKEDKEVTVVIPPSNPQVSWWDKLQAFFGCNQKVDEYVNNADNAVKNDLYELGILYCNKALECNKKSAKAYAMRGHINYWSKNYEVAYDDYLMAIKLNTNKCDFPLDKDTLRYRRVIVNQLYCCIEGSIKGNNPETNQPFEEYSLQLVQEEYQKHPHYIPILCLLTGYYIEKKDWERSERWASKLETDSKELGYLLKGIIAVEQGLKNEGAKYYEKALAINPKNSGALNNLSIIYSSQGYIERAVQMRKEAARLGDKDSQKWLEDNNYEW